jgi:hypothetical protein
MDLEIQGPRRLLHVEAGGGFAPHREDGSLFVFHGGFQGSFALLLIRSSQRGEADKVSSAARAARLFESS